jgi:hypothetical protein
VSGLVTSQCAQAAPISARHIHTGSLAICTRTGVARGRHSHHLCKCAWCASLFTTGCSACDQDSAAASSLKRYRHALLTLRSPYPVVQYRHVSVQMLTKCHSAVRTNFPIHGAWLCLPSFPFMAHGSASTVQESLLEWDCQGGSSIFHRRRLTLSRCSGRQTQRGMGMVQANCR